MAISYHISNSRHTNAGQNSQFAAVAWCENYTVHRAPIMQHHAIKIVNGDVIANDYDVLEALQQHHITTVILMGVHTNLCVQPTIACHASAAPCVTLLHLCRLAGVL